MIIADTGFWLALANAKDSHHSRAKAFILGANLHLMTTWPVMTETCHLLLNKLGSTSVIAFMESYRDRAFEVFELDETHRERIVHLMKKYRNLPMDLADASLVILAEHLGKGIILSTDMRDFHTYKWKNHQPFTNLLFPDS